MRVQHQLARELAAMRTVADPDNREAGLAALADLREIAKTEGVIEDDEPEKKRRRDQKLAAEEQQRVASARAKGLAELNATFMGLVTRDDEAPKRGYELESLLEALFKLHDIPFTPPFRKGTVEQTDGFFKFDGFSI